MMTAVKIEKICYAGWPNCYRLSDGDTELVVTTDVGPRVIRFGFIGEQNLFAEMPDQLGKSGEPWWMPRGGHRLWIAPETRPETYALDNSPVAAKIVDDGIHLAQPVEPETSMEKALTISLTIDGSVEITHHLTNRGRAPRRIAPWALTQLAPGGVGFVRFPPRGCHDACLQPTHPLVMWAYTDFSDNRWQVNQCYLVLRQDPRVHAPQKAGIFSENILSAYLLGTQLFVKRSRANPAATYPDFHCSFEIFSNGDFLELETLGPLVDLAPGQSVSHVETWSLHKDVSVNAFNDQALDGLFRALGL
ncbi:MAG: hypothetical protein JO270_23260 [Acidobacteriaceae bacterium]|nr:hypothetical protein [Acidobacteriaceae bacterium]MBV8568992.1 hypothetical protein [Acidobacteriaceae bacterium]